MNALYAELDRRQARIDELERAGRHALDALDDLAEEAGDVAAWNEGGTFYEAASILRAALRKTEATT